MFPDFKNIDFVKFIWPIKAQIILSIVILISCLVTYFWTPKKQLTLISTIIYTLTTATIALMILSTGGYKSPFVVMWTIASMSAYIYAGWGLLLITLLSGTYTAMLYMSNEFNSASIAAILISSLVPLIAGTIIWHTKSERDEIDDNNKNYRNLANELSEVATKSEVVINAIGDGVIAVDSKGSVQLINPAAQRILGWGRQDAMGLNYRSVIHLVDQSNNALDIAKDPIQQVLNNNQQIRDNSLALITKNDKRLLVSLVVSPVGEIGSGVILVFRDITKEKAEEREQAEFISTASHEMRTPVAAIEGYLGLAMNVNTATIDDRARNFIIKAHESAEHLGHLFQDLLDVSKADDGRMQNNPRVLNVVEITSNICQELNQKAVNKGLRLVFKPTTGSNRERHLTPVYHVNLDKDHTLEIISNLVENAIKYTPVGEVAVDIVGDNDHVTVSVKDSGIGIPAEDMPHLFQKFYRVENKDTREIGGTGLGLYICRRLTEIMGGRIWAESVRGKGSTFYLELPRIDSQEANRLLKIEAEKNQQEAAKIAEIKMQAATITASPTPTEAQQPIPEAPKTTSSVPRTNALTPEQIAAYVAKQRSLAAQQKAFYDQQQLLQKQQIEAQRQQLLQQQQRNINLATQRPPMVTGQPTNQSQFRQQPAQPFAQTPVAMRQPITTPTQQRANVAQIPIRTPNQPQQITQQSYGANA